MRNLFCTFPRSFVMPVVHCGTSKLSLIAFIVFALSASPTGALAELKVIYDGGQTVPIGQFYSSLIADTQPTPGSMRPRSPMAPLLFPVRTIKMTPGLFTGASRVTRKSFLLHPIFFVGDDAISRAWLLRNKDRLQQSRASGMVVNVVNYDRFKTLQNLVPGVPMAPSSADEVSKTLGIRLYPALVTIDGFVSQEVR